MDKHLPRPKDLTADPTAADGTRVFKYWIKTVENHPVKALLDTGASENFINESLIERLGINLLLM